MHTGFNRLSVLEKVIDQKIFVTSREAEENMDARRSKIRIKNSDPLALHSKANSKVCRQIGLACTPAKRMYRKYFYHWPNICF